MISHKVMLSQSDYQLGAACTCLLKMQLGGSRQIVSYCTKIVDVETFLLFASTKTHTHTERINRGDLHHILSTINCKKTLRKKKS